MATEPVKGVTLTAPIESSNELARRNIETILEFFSLYLKDKQRFYSLWVDVAPQVITPFVTADVAVCTTAAHSGWDAVKRFWDPIFDEMTGTFDWTIDDIIVGEDPNVVVTKSSSVVDVQTGPVWGSKALQYQGRYLQIFRFEDAKVKSFEEYYDTALLNSVYGA